MLCCGWLFSGRVDRLVEVDCLLLMLLVHVLGKQSGKPTGCLTAAGLLCTASRPPWNRHGRTAEQTLLLWLGHSTSVLWCKLSGLVSAMLDGFSRVQLLVEVERKL